MDYIPLGFSSSNDGMKKLDADVKAASADYTEAEEREDREAGRLLRYQGIKAGVIPSAPGDAALLAESEDDLKKAVESAKKKRRKLRATLSKRIKTRDTANELKSDIIDRKEGQVYFDGSIYTARWSSLPRYMIIVYFCLRLKILKITDERNFARF